MAENNKPFNEEFINYLGRCWLSMKQAARKFVANMNIDLTFEQVMVLKILELEEGMDLKSVAERADRERTTITRMVDGLQRRNLVVRVPDRTDKRRKFLYLTNLGKQYIRELESGVSDFLRKAYTGISADEIDVASNVLQKLTKNFEQM